VLFEARQVIRTVVLVILDVVVLTDVVVYRRDQYKDPNQFALRRLAVLVVVVVTLVLTTTSLTSNS
jgi:hypothetical protein